MNVEENDHPGPDFFVVEVSEWGQMRPFQSRAVMRRRAFSALIIGAALAVCAGGVLRPGNMYSLIVGFAAAAGAGLWAASGIHILRRIPAGPGSDQIRVTAPYAFAVSADVIRFPQMYGAAPVDWPLADTTVEVIPGPFGAKGLRLSCPGRRPRRFISKALAWHPDFAVQVVDTMRPLRAMRDNPGHIGGTR